MDALNSSPGSYPDPSTRGRPVTQTAMDTGVLLQQNYEAALADCSDESTAGTQASLSTFGRCTRLGMSAPRGTRTANKSTYSSQLEEQLKSMNEQRDTDRERIRQLEQSQKEMEESQRVMRDLIQQFMSSHQSGGQSGFGGAGGGQYGWGDAGAGQSAGGGAGGGESDFGDTAGEHNDREDDDRTADDE